MEYRGGKHASCNTCESITHGTAAEACHEYGRSMYNMYGLANLTSDDFSVLT